MGFSVPPGFRLERWALTPPFHPYPISLPKSGGLFSVALSVTTPRGGIPAHISRLNRSYAASRPVVFGLSSSAGLLQGSDSPPFQNRGEDDMNEEN